MNLYKPKPIKSYICRKRGCYYKREVIYYARKIDKYN